MYPHLTLSRSKIGLVWRHKHLAKCRKKFDWSCHFRPVLIIHLIILHCHNLVWDLVGWCESVRQSSCRFSRGADILNTSTPALVAVCINTPKWYIDWACNKYITVFLWILLRKCIGLVIWGIFGRGTFCVSMHLKYVFRFIRRRETSALRLASSPVSQWQFDLLQP